MKNDLQMVELFDSPVRIDQDGMVSLTDMWKASGKANKKQPSLFLANDGTAAFIEVLNAKLGFPSLRKSRGGSDAGTWADKLLAYKYAAWIDPEFEVGVYTVLDKFFSGELVVNPFQELHDHVLRVKISEQLGSFHGKGLSQRRMEKLDLDREGRKLVKRYQLQLTFTREVL